MERNSLSYKVVARNNCRLKMKRLSLVRIRMRLSQIDTLSQYDTGTDSAYMQDQCHVSK